MGITGGLFAGNIYLPPGLGGGKQREFMLEPPASNCVGLRPKHVKPGPPSSPLRNHSMVHTRRARVRGTCWR